MWWKVYGNEIKIEFVLPINKLLIIKQNKLKIKEKSRKSEKKSKKNLE